MNMTRSLVAAAILCAIGSYAAAGGSNDAMVQTFRNMADNAEMQAQTARNPADALRWQQTARRLRSQADAAERSGQALDDFANKALSILNKKDRRDRSEDNDD